MAIPDVAIEMQGDPNAHDSFVAGLCGILKSWNRDVDYAYVAGLSGIAFSPVLDTGEDCRAWWTEGGDDIRLDFLGQALGFTVEKIQVGTGVDDWEAYASFDDMPEQRARHLRRLRSAMSEGKMVIVRTWPSWSVLAGWSDDLTKIPFETMPGFGDLVGRILGPNKTGLAYIISIAEPALSKDEASREALTFGKTVADGSFENDRFHYGGEIYTAFAERLDHEVFCEPCGDRSWSCAIRTLRRIGGTANSAADFLEQNSLDAVAKEYRAIGSAASGYKGKQLEEGWRDPAFRAGLAQQLLKLLEHHQKATEALVDQRAN